MDTPAFRPPMAYYRCAVQSQIPMELHNVTMQQRSMFVAGSGATVALSALGVAAATLYGRARQRSLEGQVRYVPAQGDAVLMDDRVVLHLVGSGKVRGVRVTSDAADRTVDIEVPYALLKRWGKEPAGVYLDIVGRGVIWLQPSDNGEFAQWLAHLSHEKLWKPPTSVELAPEVPVVGWCQQDPRYTFGLPEGWGDPDRAMFAAFAPRFDPLVLRAMVGSTDGDLEAQVLVVEAVGDDARNQAADPESMAVEWAAATNIQPVGAMQTVTVGGHAACLTRGRSSTPEGIADRTYAHVTRNGLHFVLWYQVLGGTIGDGNHERWLPAFRTMLATWHWYA